MKRVGAAVLIGLLLATLLVPAASAAMEPYSLFGDAELVSPGYQSDMAVKVRSDASHVDGYGGIDFAVTDGLTFADLTVLSTDYMFEEDDTCGGGSPRIAVELTSTDANPVTGYVFFYPSPLPSYDDCASGVWVNSGNLIDDELFVDSGQFLGGTSYDPVPDAMTRYGAYTVNSIFLVMDGSWKFDDGEQTAFFDNTNINGTVYTYEAATAEELLDQLRQDTSEVNNQWIGRSLQAPLILAQFYMDRGQTQVANVMLWKYTLMLRIYSIVNFVPADVANPLIEQAQEIINMNRNQQQPL